MGQHKTPTPPAPQDSKDPGHFGNQGRPPQTRRNPTEDKEERYQRNREQAPTGQPNPEPRYPGKR